MRLWSLHPKYLDPRGLVALWREALLAKAVLREETRGYRNHPQLERFRAHPKPLLAIDAYLDVVQKEATARKYSFDRAKIGKFSGAEPIPTTNGQLQYEWQHLLNKLKQRAPAVFNQWAELETPALHPLFIQHAGPIESWERPASR